MSPTAKSGIFLSAGVCIFGFADNLMLFISEQVSVGQFHFHRSIIAGFIVLLIAYFKRETIKPKSWKAVSTRTVFNTIAMILYFGIIPMMPIAEAGAGLFTSPIFVLIFSYLFLKQTISKLQIIAFALGLVGVLLILGTNLSELTLFHTFPILAGASYAVGVIITNRHCSNESPFTLLLAFLVAIGLVGLIMTIWFTIFPVSNFYLNQAPFLFNGWQTVDSFYWSIMVIVGLAGALAIYLMIVAYQIGNPTFSAIYEYVYLIAAGFFSWYIWAVTPGIYSFIGILAIVVAGSIIAFNNPKKI